MARLLRSTSFTTSRRDRTRASSYSVDARFQLLQRLLHLPIPLRQPLFELLDIARLADGVSRSLARLLREPTSGDRRP